ncbi:nucleotide exchange factor GrpE [Bacteroidota bacterium]
MQKRPKKNKDTEELNNDLEQEEFDISDSDEDIDEVEADEIPETADEKVAELNDRFLRLYSEFDNYRKRTIKERIDLSKTASAEVITDLLPVLDDFERAIRAFTETDSADSALKEGVILIFNKFLNIMTQKGLEQMKTIGEPFDTDFHEAITSIPAPSPDLKGKVVDEVEKGYLLNDKVIRYAKVVVGA